MTKLCRPHQKPAQRRRLRRRRWIGDAPEKPRDEQDNHALTQSHVNEETDGVSIAFRQIVTELAEQEAAKHENGGEPVQNLRNGAVARCRVGELHSSKPLPPAHGGRALFGITLIRLQPIAFSIRASAAAISDSTSRSNIPSTV